MKTKVPRLRRTEIAKCSKVAQVSFLRTFRVLPKFLQSKHSRELKIGKQRFGFVLCLTASSAVLVTAHPLLLLSLDTSTSGLSRSLSPFQPYPILKS